MAAEEKWYFTREQLANTPSRKSGYDADKELSCRQQAANFIQDMGQRLLVNQLCINTAIVYMHRFYMFHSFTRFHRNAMAAAALFLAAKVEEQPRKLEHVIKVAQICLHREQPPPDVKSEVYIEQAQELVVNENILLQTLGFDVAIDHPHTHVVRCCHLVRASKDLAQTSYFMASNSLHLTTMCLQYKPTVVACFCIHLAYKWSNWEIPQSNEGKPWFWYIDKTVTQELLEQLTDEFLAIFDKCPSRLKKKIMSISSNQNPTILSAFSNDGDKKRNGEGSSNQSGITFGGSSDDLKKKQEYMRHHPDYKKHHIPHHARADNHSMSKSSCMFGPPTRTIPQNHNNAGGVNSANILRSLSGGSSSSKESGSLLSGKPEHLHHRPRRPDDNSKQQAAHPSNSSTSTPSSSTTAAASSSNSSSNSSRNHELITTQSATQYKKYDKVTSGSGLSDFQSSANSIANNSSNNSNNISNRIAMSSSNSNNYLNTSQGHMQSASNMYIQQQQLIASSHIPSAQGNNQLLQNQQNIDVLSRISSSDSVSNNASGQALSNKHQQQLLPPQQVVIQSAVQQQSSIQAVTNQSKLKSPGLLSQPQTVQQQSTTKIVERSIFSPEKSTPPSESIKLAVSSSFLAPGHQQQHGVNVGQSSNAISQPQSSNVLRKKSDSLINDSTNVMSHTKLTDELSSSVVQNKLTNPIVCSSVMNQFHHTVHNETVIKPAVEIKEEKPSDTSAVASSTIDIAEPLVSIPVSASSAIAVNASDDAAAGGAGGHSKEQKKKKKKHKEHKDKHKDKHKHKHKSRDPEPIVITIPKEKLTLPQQTPEQGILKIKIAKDKIASSISPAPTGLKIKIPKEKIKESRKRERSEDSGTGGGPGKFHRPNGTTLKVNNNNNNNNINNNYNAIDMECSDNENDKSNNFISIESTNSTSPPPIDLNDACPPSFDEILRPETPPGMSLLELFDTKAPTSNNTNTLSSSGVSSSVDKQSTSTPLLSTTHIPSYTLHTKFRPPDEPQSLVDPYRDYDTNYLKKHQYQNRQNGAAPVVGGYNRNRYPPPGGANRRRIRGGYHLPPRHPPLPAPPPLPPTTGGYGWGEVLRHSAAMPHPPAMHGYIMAPPPPHMQHYYHQTAMIVPNFPPPPPLPDDPPPAQPPPPPPE